MVPQNVISLANRDSTLKTLLPGCLLTKVFNKNIGTHGKSNTNESFVIENSGKMVHYSSKLFSST